MVIDGVLQHAPYDAMVLVTQGYYVDQQLKATDGKWKVNTVSIELIFSDCVSCLSLILSSLLAC